MSQLGDLQRARERHANSKPVNSALNTLLCPTIVTDGGPWAQHNMPCAVYQQQKAVYSLGTGIFLPSWEAQKDGFMLIRPPKWMRKFLKKYVPY